MRRTLILFVSISILSTSLYSQVKKKTQTTSKPEIDRLYEKYKNTDFITLYTPHGELEGSVKVEMNDDDKAKSVYIQGHAYNQPAIVAHLTNTIRMKLQQGYKPIKNYTYDGTYSDLIERQMMTFDQDGTKYIELAFSKGRMNFLVGVGLKIIPGEYNSVTYYKSKDVVSGYYWYIKTEDTARAAGSGGSTFEF